jgi:phosphoadenosine phosphosulfate reductase
MDGEAGRFERGAILDSSLASGEIGPLEHSRLIERFGDVPGETLLRAFIVTECRGRIAAVSSFGTEAAVLLALVAEIDRAVPVIFLDTGKMFGETLRYRDALVAHLGLSDVWSLRPDPDRVRRTDPDGTLWHRDPDACCRLRKVEPLGAALTDFDAWISGRKRYQGGLRATIPTIESVDGKIKLNPLAAWSPEKLAAEFAKRDLPRHPLEADGFFSIGCVPCTERVARGEDRRAGRWRDRAKTECGIHVPRSELP